MTNLNDKFMVSLDLRGLMDCAKRPLLSYINQTSFMLPITEFSVHKNPVKFTEPIQHFRMKSCCFFVLVVLVGVAFSASKLFLFIIDISLNLKKIFCLNFAFIENKSIGW